MFGGVDNVNFYHYLSCILLAKSTLPQLSTYLIIKFYFVFVNKHILGYIDIIVPLIPIFMPFLYIGSFVPKTQPNVIKRMQQTPPDSPTTMPSANLTIQHQVSKCSSNHCLAASRHRRTTPTGLHSLFFFACTLRQDFILCSSLLAPCDGRLLLGAIFADMASWPFIFCFREGKLILDNQELEQHILERLEVCQGQWELSLLPLCICNIPKEYY